MGPSRRHVARRDSGCVACCGCAAYNALRADDEERRRCAAAAAVAAAALPTRAARRRAEGLRSPRTHTAVSRAHPLRRQPPPPARPLRRGGSRLAARGRAASALRRRRSSCPPCAQPPLPLRTLTWVALTCSTTTCSRRCRGRAPTPPTPPRATRDDARLPCRRSAARRIVGVAGLYATRALYTPQSQAARRPAAVAAAAPPATPAASPTRSDTNRRLSKLTPPRAAAHHRRRRCARRRARARAGRPQVPSRCSRRRRARARRRRASSPPGGILRQLRRARRLPLLPAFPAEARARGMGGGSRPVCHFAPLSSSARPRRSPSFRRRRRYPAARHVAGDRGRAPLAARRRALPARAVGWAARSRRRRRTHCDLSAPTRRASIGRVRALDRPGHWARLAVFAAPALRLSVALLLAAAGASAPAALTRRARAAWSRLRRPACAQRARGALGACALETGLRAPRALPPPRTARVGRCQRRRLFALASAAYTLACPLAGSPRERLAHVSSSAGWC